MAGGTRKETRVVEIRVDSKEFKQATRAINQGLKGIQKEARSVGNSLKAAFAIVGVRELVQWGKGIINAMAEVERLDKVLEGASASQEEFAESLDFVRDTADEYGLSMLLLEEGFSHFMAAGKQAGLEMEAIQTAFEGLSISAAAFQVSGTELQLMLQGARQLMGSTTVNMEDLRQVTERLPGSVGAAVDAVREMTGDLELTGQGMRKLIAEGKIATDEFFPLFTQRLEEMNLKGAAANSNTFRAALNRLNNSLSDLAREMGPVLDVLADFIGLLTQAVGALRAVIANVGDFKGTVAALAGTSRATVEMAEAAEQMYDAQVRLDQFRKQGPSLADQAAAALGFDIDRETQLVNGLTAATERYNKIYNELSAARVAASRAAPAGDIPVPGLGAPPGVATGSGRAGGGGALKSIQDDAAKAAEELADLREETLDLQSAWDPMYDLQKEFAEGMDLIAEATARGAISMDENIAISEKFIEHMTAKMDELNKSTEDVSRIAEDMADTFVDAFDAMIFGGESFSDVLRSLERQLINMVAQNLFFEPLSNALAGSDLFGWVASAVAPRQFGGPVEANTPYLVGERGPELMIPSQSGTVVSNEDLMGSGPNGVSVVMNFNGPVSGEGLRQSASQLAAQVGAQTQRALFRNG